MDKTRAVAGVAAVLAALTLWAGPVAAQTGTDCSTCDTPNTSGGGGSSLPGDVEVDEPRGGSVSGEDEGVDGPSTGGDSDPVTGELPEEGTTNAPGQAEAPAAEAPADTGGGLPVTGGDVLGLAAIGATAIALGTVLTRRAKRTSVPA